MRQKLTIFAVFLLLISKSFGQETIIEHKIEKGETAYFIAQKYKVSLEEIYKLNPNAQNGLVDNQVLKIPMSASENKKSQKLTHTVAPKETLFGLSKQYYITIEELQNVNQETLADGLKIGQILVIPHKFD